MTSLARSEATCGLHECCAASPELLGHHPIRLAAAVAGAAAAGVGQSWSSGVRPPRSMNKTYIKILGTLYHVHTRIIPLGLWKRDWYGLTIFCLIFGGIRREGGTGARRKALR